MSTTKMSILFVFVILYVAINMWFSLQPQRKKYDLEIPKMNMIEIVEESNIDLDGVEDILALAG